MLTKTLIPRSLFRLVPRVKHYDWGGSKFIPTLLGCENPEGRPFAEMWMGAHPASPSFVPTEGDTPLGLDALIAQNPEFHLGHETQRDFGSLPFLLKVLDVVKPLSIQVHPGRDQAQAGFDEEEGDIPRSAPFRNFKDPFHKPEMVMALEGSFWVLAGFRPVAEIRQTFVEHPELRPLVASFESTSEGLKDFYKKIMSSPQVEIEKILRPLLNRWTDENNRNPFIKADPRYWVLKANTLYSSPEVIDRGLLSILLMNLIKMVPGDALYLPSGLLHAFLEGIAIEISANSDNVLRGGLTHKHVDIHQLLKTVTFEEKPLSLVRGVETQKGESVFSTEAKEFELRRFVLRKGESRAVPSSWSSRIFFVASGPAELRVEVDTDQGRATFHRGESFFVPRGGAFVLHSSEESVVFQAGTPPVDTLHGRRPIPLGFGTSGLRGRISDITDVEAYVNARGFLRTVLEKSGLSVGPIVSIGMDLRPSSPRIAEAVARAVREEGGSVEYLGRLPSPALMAYGCARNRASVMVTGSHIPFDRNGIKFNFADGEISKEDESKILAHVQDLRAEEYNRPEAESFFDEHGFFKPSVDPSLPPETGVAREFYVRRYLDFFPAEGLRGMKVVVYQHSAVGRDLLVDVLRGLGATVIPLGRSDEFVPIDTEDISDERLSDLQWMANGAKVDGVPVDALLSTDGDSDRPLLCGARSDGTLVFFPGDMVGPLVAEYLEADGVVAPVSVNDGVDEFLKEKVLPRTRIGSPFVIEGMRAAGGSRKTVVGYEANGGVLLQNEIHRWGRRLAPLPTRDAMLPILCVLFSAKERSLSLAQLFDRLPRRFTKAGLLDNFPKEKAQTFLRSFAPLDSRATVVDFGIGGELSAQDEFGNTLLLTDETVQSLKEARQRVEAVFNERNGFMGGLVRINFLDGLRLQFGNKDVAHIRPSGNAPQLRIYACAGTLSRVQEIVRLGLQEPGGLIRALADGVRRGRI